MKPLTLDDLLHAARDSKMSDDERREQAASFAFGQLALTKAWRNRPLTDLTELRTRCRELAGLSTSVMAEIVKISVKMSPSGRGPLLITEFRVQQKSHPFFQGFAGPTHTWIVRLHNPSTYADIRALMLSVLGANPHDATEPQADAASLLARAVCGSEAANESLRRKHGIDASVVVGVQLERVPDETRDGKPITRFLWRPAER